MQPSVLPQPDRFWSRVRPGPDCWEWLGNKQLSGYGAINVYPSDGVVGSKLLRRRAHRVAWELIYGPVPDGLCVLHHCDNPGCVSPEHLYLGTMADNIRDRENRGRRIQFRGSRLPQAKLTEAKVAEIRSLKGSASHYKIAARYGVSRATVQLLMSGKTWKHVQGG